MDSPSAHEQTSSVTVEHFIDQFLSAVCDSRRRHILAYLTTVSEHEASRSVGEIAAHLKGSHVHHLRASETVA